MRKISSLFIISLIIASAYSNFLSTTNPRNLSQQQQQASNSSPDQNMQTSFERENDPDFYSQQDEEESRAESNISNDASQDTNICSAYTLALENYTERATTIQYQNQQWTDEAFPRSIALNNTQYNYTRASSVLSKVHIFGVCGVRAYDVKQGELFNSNLLAALSALAGRPDFLKSIFLIGDNRAGIYSVRLWVGGKPLQVIVDDYFPTNSQGDWAFTSQRVDSQLWPMILEKAYAKIMGGYQFTQRQLSSRILHTLTGVPTHRLEHSKNNATYLFDRMQRAQCNGFFMGAYTNSQSCGLVKYQAYAPLNVYRDVRGSDGNLYNLVKLYNPKGVDEWKGKFSKNSSIWGSRRNSQFGTKWNYGQFMMNVEDYKRCFESTIFAQVREGYTHIYEQFKNTSGVVKKRFQKSTNATATIIVEMMPNELIKSTIGCQHPLQSIQYSVSKYIDGVPRRFGSTRRQLQRPITLEDVGTGVFQISVNIVYKSFVPEFNSFVIHLYTSEEDTKFYDPTDTLVKCLDSEKVDRKLSNGSQWYMSGQGTTAFNCNYFTRWEDGFAMCHRFGTWGVNQGMTANDACVACGGGQCP